MLRIPRSVGPRHLGWPSWDDIKDFASDAYNEVKHAAPVVGTAAACIASENPAVCAAAGEQAYSYYQDLRERYGSDGGGEDGEPLTVHVDTDNTVQCGGVRYTYWSSSSFYPQPVCGASIPPGLVARVIPNTGETAYTEPGTFLYVRTGPGFAPEAFPRVGNGDPPSNWEVLGYWGNSPLYVFPDDKALVSPAILAGLSEAPSSPTVLDIAAAGGEGASSGEGWSMAEKAAALALAAGAAWAGYRYYKGRPIWPF